MAVTTINIDSQVLTFANLAAFPITGTVKTIYIAEDTNFQYYWDGSQYVLLTTDINIPANLIFYATTAPSSVPGYERLVISPDDVDYDNPAVDVPTGAITTTAQLVGEQVADANIFAGNPGILNISTIGEIRRTSGTGTAEFYFEIYQRTSLGVETLIGTSNKTVPISGGVYQQFQTDCLFNNGTWLSTDRVVIKFYADRVVGGSNPNYDFLFGGANPVRTLFPISAQLLLNVPIAIGITGVTGGILDEVLLTDGSGKLGQSELKTVGGNSLFGSGDIPVGGGITIGTTAIASGTVNRILFQGAGDVVQQDSTFVWNNTNKRLILGTEAVADANTRLVITGSGSGSSTTTFGLKVHNSTGTNNALIVRDDSAVFLSASDYESANNFQGGLGFRVGNLINFSTAGGLVIGTSNTNAQGILNHNNVTVVGNSNTYRFLTNQSVVCVGRNNTVWAGNGTVIGHGNSTGGGLGAASNAVLIGVSNSIATNSNAIGIGNNIAASSNQGIFIGSSINNANLTNNNNHIIGNYFNVTSSSQLNRAIVMGQGVSDASRAVPNINDSFSIYFQDLQRSFFVNKNSNIVLRSLGALTAGTQYDTNATNTLTLHNGTPPATNIADAFQLYSADRVAGQAGAVIRSENGTQHIFSDRVGIRTITPNATLQINGEGTGALATTFGLQVHDSTGTNNALVVRDDGFVGFGTATANLSNIFRIVNSTLTYFDISADGGVQIGRNAAISTNSGAGNNVAIAIGKDAIARAITAGGVAIGNSALAGVGNVAIGQSATAGISSGFTSSGAAIAIGQSTVANTSGGSGGIAIGRSASASSNGTDNITLAQDSSITSNLNVANIMIGRFLSVSTNSRSYAYAIGSGVSSASRATLGIDNSFSLYFNNNERSFFVNSLSNIVLRSQQSLVAGTQYDTNATNTLTLHNGTAPTTNIADAFQQYSADIVAGNAAPHFRTENGNIIKLYQETTGIAAAAFVANTSLIADDTATFGGYTIGQVVAALKAQGLLA